jgi:DnaJ-like protein
MAAADMAAWRRNNSDAVSVEIEMLDGSKRKGTILVPRNKVLREILNDQLEAFIDFECRRDGALLLAKSSIKLARALGGKATEAQAKIDDQAKIDTLTARKAELERQKPHQVLGVPQNVDKAALHKAYIAKAREYHPDRFVDSKLPLEVIDYLNAMARQINSAYEDLKEISESR